MASIAMLSVQLQLLQASSSNNNTMTPVFFGSMGAASAIVFASMGSAYGTAKSGVGICAMGVMRPDILMRNIIPTIMAGVLAIYGLIVSVIIAIQMNNPAEFSYAAGFAALGAGLSVGLSSFAAGFAIGVVGDAGVRAVAQQSKVYVGMILILIFAEALGLYGLIVSLILQTVK